MSLIIDPEGKVFDTSAIKKGWLVYAKNSGWDEGRCGIATEVTEDKLIVQFHPGVGNIINHFVVTPEEVEEGKWTLRWSEDLVTISQYPEVGPEPDPDPDPEPEPEADPTGGDNEP